MSIDEGRFHTLADAALQALVDALDDAIGDVADVERQDGVATITFDDGRQFVVNKHGPTRQIWLSSPISGGWHFAWAEAGECWRATRDDTVTLMPFLSQEIAAITGIAIAA